MENNNTMQTNSSPPTDVPHRLPPCLIFVLETNKDKHGKIRFSLPLKHDSKTGLYSSPIIPDVCPINIFIKDKELFEKRAVIKPEVAPDMDNAVPADRHLMKITPRTLKQIRLTVLCQDIKTASTYRFYEQHNTTHQFPLDDDALIFPKDLKIHVLNKFITTKGKRIACVAKIELGRAFIDIAQVELAKMVRDMNERTAFSLPVKRKREEGPEEEEEEAEQQCKQHPQHRQPQLFKSVDETVSVSTPLKKRYRADNSQHHNDAHSRSSSPSSSPTPSSPSKAHV